jgi:hypothetical protein
MRRALCLLTLGMVAVASTGCRLSWPSCLRNLGGFGGFETEVYECDPCTTYYGPEAVSGEWIVEPGTGGIDVLPGPALSGSRSG